MSQQWKLILGAVTLGGVAVVSVSSITGRLFTLPDSTVVFPGHGANTTIAKAKVEYGVFASKSHEDDLHGNVTWLED